MPLEAEAAAAMARPPVRASKKPGSHHERGYFVVTGFRIWGGLGFRICGLGFRIWGLGFRIWGLGLKASGLGFIGFKDQGATPELQASKPTA